jgi:hypothetical protein
MRASMIALMLLLGVGAAQAADEKTRQGPSAAALALESLPQELGAYRRSGAVRDLDRLRGGAGQGAVLRYIPRNNERIIASVIVYDRGRHRAPEGGQNPDVNQEVRAAIDELHAVQRMGHVRSVAFATGMDISGNSQSGSMRCANFRVIQQDGAPTADSVCITVQNGRFLKIRLTSWVSPEPMSAGMFAAALLSAVWEAQARAAR